MDARRWDDVFILTGPTASGKTALGLCLAERLEAEIVSLDSMAVYRGMDLGTAKPTLAERARVPHHLVDVREPWEQATSAWWTAAAETALADLRRRGQRTLIVGGTPLYLKAFLRGLFEGPAADPTLRAKLEELSNEEITRRLGAVDPASAAKLHANDRRRRLRALEVFEQTGRPLSAWQTQFGQPTPLPRPGLWLDWPRPLLHERINQRVLAMVEAGLLEECRRLRELPQPLCKEAAQAAGYAECFAVLDGKLTLDEAVPLIQLRTRQLAKRQVTWFRHLEELEALPVGEAYLLEAALRRWRL